MMVEATKESPQAAERLQREEAELQPEGWAVWQVD